MNEIKCYTPKLLHSDWNVPYIEMQEDVKGNYCLSYHIQELQDEIFNLRAKHNDWEGEGYL